MNHPIAWHSPAPLWPTGLLDSAARTRFRRPEILRFDSDSFMEDVQATLADNPAQLSDRRLRSETWRAVSASLPGPAEAVKLYQPSHARYYLVIGSLVCQRPGMPDRTVNLPDGDQVFFVMRRKTDEGEEGWFGEEIGWVAVAPLDSVAEGEERQPLFPLHYQQEIRVNGRTKIQPRRLHAGLVPVSSFQTHQATGRSPIPASTDEDLEDDALQDPRLSQFEAVINDGLRPLRDAIESGGDAAPSEAEKVPQEVLAFALLDLHLACAEHLEDLDDAFDAQSSAGLSPALSAIYDQFAAAGDWIEWLDGVREVADALINGEFATSGFLSDVTAATIKTAVDALLGTSAVANDNLRSAIADALGEFSGAYGTGEETSADPHEQPKFGVPGKAEGETAAAAAFPYVIRFAYERPKCTRKFEQMVAPDALDGLRAVVANHSQYKPVVSQPTQPFTLASFYDPDAPQRPIRIAMPVDTSIAGLRKFPRNVSFLLSNKLRQQMQQVGKDVTDLGSGDKGTLDLGVMCSFSIPIITIVALILLILFVFLLNIVFWWLPFFRICFPLGLTFKKS